ncbi:VPS9 domain-containing protein 1 isoform X1 [Sparus aurata]|uniref:VPS9 domain containing 1 n=2 Tax=Sparus aurata TaxID=8175 RepID=A0A671Y388_SPAAU|nr:VPS9 domain-containing protein 1 isoform X1 [Sparus aurata]XP_030281229.1 VPS9 domain-containing protein 1 isoform X1 [Sparus aurata]XP_030281230.1 VPS9 domain-containing protein 1 isoform X1 [Sparus aurata]XP_030281231.1 VPS9 domain-containing protein 1 isoform X1 [Sparus aurata]
MAAADSGAKPLQNAMKMAKVAIQLDVGNKHKEAYCEYLRIISFISHALLEEAGLQKEREMDAVEVERMLRLAEQCLERAKSFIGKNADPPDPASISASSSCSPGQSELYQTAVLPATTASSTVLPFDIPIDTGCQATSPTKTGYHRVLSDGGGEPSPFLPPEIFQRLQTVQSQDTSKKELTPIEEASRLNQKLKANYEARLARLTPGQAYQKTSLTLSLQRHMMENLIIAKARQDALQRKMEERRLRLQEEANRRFAASGAMTAEEQEQRILYTNVLEYEQDHDWPKLWKANMKKNPDDVALVSGLVSYLFSRSDHPVVKLLRKHQYRLYNRLYPIVSKGLPQSPALTLSPSRSTHNLLHPENLRKPTRTLGKSASGQIFSPGSSPSLSHDLDTNYNDEEVEEPHTQVSVDRENSFEDLEQFLTQLDWAQPHSSTDDTGSDLELTYDQSMQDERNTQEMEMRALTEHLKAIVKDIHIAIDQLLSLCLLSFECLNTASSKDLCLASIEEAFFTPLWSALLALFRKVHREREQAFEMSMKLYQDASPGVVGVPLKLFPQEPGSYPYESAVQELKLLITDCCPQRKLECIVRTLRLICACAEDYRCLHEVDSTPKTAAIGADDLLPILSFVALQCQCPQLVSECAALEEFIHEGYLIGEEGYCLTSMQSALAYIESLHTGGAQLPSDKLI